ncbi:MAG: hypothetical protein Ct9H300mP28_10060 [Pseudomonadota bacterium]|nr:MAG: hypothetical protein Ct9H300mP28_10060 [Pseudomonadota bacterium]
MFTTNLLLWKLFRGFSAVIYNIGIIREFPANGITYESLHYLGAKRCIDAAVNFKIKRFILMSANGVKTDGTGYQKTKMLAEEYLKSVNLDIQYFVHLWYSATQGETAGRNFVRS